MLAAGVDAHVDRSRHVAVHTGRARSALPVAVVIPRRVVRHVAAGAERIAAGQHRPPVGLVAVRAPHPGAVHGALQPGAQLEGLLPRPDAAVRAVGRAVQQRRAVMIQERTARRPRRGDRHPAAVAGPAGRHLLLGAARGERLIAAAVAGLAAHVRGAAVAAVAAAGYVVALHPARGVTGRALVIPAPGQARPVQRIPRVPSRPLDRGIEPALAGHIPGDRRHQQAPAAVVQQVLLERAHPDGAHHRPAPAAEAIIHLKGQPRRRAQRPRHHAAGGHRRPVEAPQGLRGLTGGPIVLGARPGRGLLGVAARAGPPGVRRGPRLSEPRGGPRPSGRWRGLRLARAGQQQGDQQSSSSNQGVLAAVALRVSSSPSMPSTTAGAVAATSLCSKRSPSRLNSA